MPRSLLPCLAVLVACTASPQEAAMRNPGPGARPAAKNSAAAAPADTAAAARGRRTLSTAFVMLGPGGQLTVELRDGRVLVLRDVVMRRTDYCGVQIAGARARWCGGYAEIAAARAGGAPALDPR
jgi:hypothetical protein